MAPSSGARTRGTVCTPTTSADGSVPTRVLTGRSSAIQRRRTGTGGMLIRMSIANSFDPSQGRAIPEDQVSEDGLPLDEDTAAALGISFDVVGGASADPTRVSPVDVSVPVDLSVPSAPSSAD